ncbi:MAG: hypothetical protein F6K63_23485 [Moorea sp. SIO1G6]|uniref:hypothetical protein n=1 Tax=Moorena sp. SIO1G6 TaxID=2607840 RepID=UPI0013C22E71|nr:hypothetical protein [Moorena sp. SIO1G6]NET67187.1 hypothetical protein [Moorena sp. SIO1G6]
MLQCRRLETYHGKQVGLVSVGRMRSRSVALRANRLWRGCGLWPRCANGDEAKLPLKAIARHPSSKKMMPQ